MKHALFMVTTGSAGRGNILSRLTGNGGEIHSFSGPVGGIKGKNC